MTASSLTRSYAEVRRRLRCPPNAVEDTGINMRNGWPLKLGMDLPNGVTGVPDIEPESDVPERTRNEKRKRISPYLVPPECRWSMRIGGSPLIPRAALHVTPRHVLMAVAKVWDIEPAVLLGPSMRYFAVAPRLVMMAVAYRLTGYSTLRVGRELQKDKSSVSHASGLMRHHIEAVAKKLGDSRDPLLWAYAMREQTGGVF